MSLVASSISGAAYVLANNEDRDSGNGFEFTRRKRWPQLLLSELTGSALFCLKPVSPQRSSIGSSDGQSNQKWSWKIIFVSPSVGDMLGQKAQDLEGRDFLDLVYGSDQSQIQHVFTSLLTPSLSHHASSNSTSTSTQSGSVLPHSTSTRSQTAYIRMNTSSDSVSSSGSSRSGNGNGSGHGEANGGRRATAVWEIRAHATGVEGVDSGPGGFGLGGAGTMIPQASGGEETRGKAIWVMGRRVGEGGGEGEGNGNGNGNGNGQSLDAFLELKLENERLREELKELQMDFDDYDDFTIRAPYIDPSPSRPPYHLSNSSANSSTSSSPSSSPASSPSYAVPKNKPGRPPKDRDPGAREKKRKKTATTTSARGNAGAEGEGMHVCVTCGRTDSPEWRKGPLGPKTLCNACGLRWAKRNSTAPSRKDRKIVGQK